MPDAAVERVIAPSVLSPFAGLRIADFSWVIAAPLATQYFSLHGADVIRIESRLRPDVLRKAPPYPSEDTGSNGSAYFANYNMGKRGVTLNLRDPRAAELARRLVATCDVVSENFTPGTMERFGLGYQALRAVKPDLIMLSMSLAGQSGPDRRNKGFGTVIQGSAGVTQLTGWPDRDPVGTGVAYTDFFAAHVAAVALLGALDHRRRTGEGQFIDLSQQEASMEALEAALLAYSANGVELDRAGNRHPVAAPHGVYPCRPDPHYPEERDRWIAIAVMKDEHWRGLVAAMGAPSWAVAPVLRTLLGRKAREDELDALVAAWTLQMTAEEAERLLVGQGVPAAVVANARDLHADARLRHRGHFIDTAHPVIADFPLDSVSYRLNGAQPLPPRSSPLLGGDNAAVYQSLLGLDEGEYRALAADGVFE